MKRVLAPVLLAALAGCNTAPSDADVLAAAVGTPGEVRLFRDAGAGFEPAGTAPIQGLTSLDAHAESETVLVAGLSHRLVPTLLAEYMPTLFVVALESTDTNLTHWVAHSWRVEASGAAMIDPALVTGPKGRELWFVQVDGPGDPAAGEKPARVVRTRWTGTRFAAATVMYEGRGVVDPSPIYDGESWRLFLTRNHREIVEVSADRPEPRVVAAGLTVPHVTRQGDTLRLSAQDGSHGPSAAVELQEVGGVWSGRTPLQPAGDREPCTSPSTVEHAGARWLLCAMERPGG